MVCTRHGTSGEIRTRSSWVETRDATENTSDVDGGEGRNRTDHSRFARPARLLGTCLPIDGFGPPGWNRTTVARVSDERPDHWTTGEWVDRADSNRLSPGSQPGPSTTSGSANIRATSDAKTRRALPTELPPPPKRWRAGFEPATTRLEADVVPAAFALEPRAGVAPTVSRVPGGCSAV